MAFLPSPSPQLAQMEWEEKLGLQTSPAPGQFLLRRGITSLLLESAIGSTEDAREKKKDDPNGYHLSPGCTDFPIPNIRKALRITIYGVFAEPVHWPVG